MMVTVAVSFVPSAICPTALFSSTIMISSSSNVLSSLMLIVKVLSPVSPSAQLKVPEVVW